MDVTVDVGEDELMWQVFVKSKNVNRLVGGRRQWRSIRLEACQLRLPKYMDHGLPFPSIGKTRSIVNFCPMTSTNSLSSLSSTTIYSVSHDPGLEAEHSVITP